MRTTILCYLLMFSVEGQILKFVDDTPEIIRDSATVTSDWEHLEKVLKGLINEGMKLLLPSLTDNARTLNISSTCFRDTMQVIGGIRKLKTWAMRFLDSTAKGIDGMITGTLFSFGAYDECIDTKVINQRSGSKKGEVMFTGKYCLLRIKPHLPEKRKDFKDGIIMDELKGIYKANTVLSEVAVYGTLLYTVPFRMGICVPSGCSLDDVNNMFSIVADYTKLYMNVKRCEVKEEPKYTPTMIFVMSLYSFSGFLVLLGTLTDVYFYYSDTKPNRTAIRLLLAFSFIKNFRKLVDTSTSSKTLSCLNGIRFLTMSWIILEHSYLLVLFQVVSGLTYIRPMLKDLAFQVVVLPSVSVDTFFFLGGFLVCYLTTKHVKIAKGKLNILVYILHRIWRILPVLVFVVLFAFLLELMATGPIAHNTFKPFVEGCQSNWWASLLFINNYYHASEPCLTHTWYLALDMQFYIAALIILLPLFRWPKVGISIALGSIVLSVITSAVVVYLKDLPPTFIVTDVNMTKLSAYLTEFYFKPYSHIGPYVIGILSGYYLVMNPRIKIPKMVQWFGWCCAIICSTAAIYGTYEWNSGRDATMLETIMYASLHRIGWALSIAWMVICCATGHGGVVNYILSWKVWIPLGRLTYMAYLVHFLVQISFVAVFRSPLDPVHAFGVWLFFGHLMATYGIAFAGAMLVESPFMSLEKIFLPQKKENRTEKDSSHALDTVKEPTEEGTQNINNKLRASQLQSGTVCNGTVSNGTVSNGTVCNRTESTGTDNAGFVYRL